jgi:uncharacterized repeat protein (TIGR01451 family)
MAGDVSTGAGNSTGASDATDAGDSTGVADAGPADADRGWPASWVDPVAGGVVERERTLGRAPDGAAAAGEGRRDGAVVDDYRTGHWRGVSAVAFFVCGFGLVLRQPGLVVAGVLGVVYAGYAGSARPPRTTDGEGESVLELRREVAESTPNPGEEVGVRTTVVNAGTDPLTDVRMVDGVPEGMDVVEGSPRLATALRAGEAATVEYRVAVPRGDHEWGPAHVVVADPSASVERETTVGTATSVRAVPPALSTDELPLQDLTTPYTGRIPTEAGGDGVEFHATREYRPGDPLRRIDWYRRAKTGELGTLEFREERAGTVVVLVDARKASYLAPAPGARHAVARSVDAALQSFDTLLDTGDRAGIAVFGRGGAWLPPGAGDDHHARGRELLTTHPAVSAVPPEEGAYEGLLPDRRATLRGERIDQVAGRLPDDAQVIVFSPCCDDYVARTVRRLDAYGHAVTLVSPDPTTDRGPGERLARLERRDRLAALRRAGIRVLDWPDGEAFATTLERARARWSG